MALPDENAVYGFVSTNMKIWPCSFDRDQTDLELLVNDMLTIILLKYRGIDSSQTSFGVTLNGSKALIIGTRFAYCCACGRFSDGRLNDLKNKIFEAGQKICPRYFNQTVSEVMHFAALEPDFMRKQHI
ncbi:hypothetical protein [Xenorhabdus sp. KJ12.1]|uniref:hypothetical protein n=1 Tax=Xenorhabdus sp. KJ12.1 TaxID=1851571 RepID=UPI000C039CBB|nr:hypothetical protein [Xenorhabdus sp. KJ12.1]PHM72212.1 hypothetical protein Xekj_00490 [Xenorhabdus sp. KJ12.1]